MPGKPSAGPCCEDFVRLHSNIGRRGFSIRTEGGTRATLHFNAVPAHEETKLADAARAARVVVQAEGREAIRHCPFCGKRLGT
jgi:hypothetical protein